MVRGSRLFVLTVALALGCGGPSEGVTEKIGWTSEPVVVCAGASVVQGVDVSEFQGTINWTQVHASGRAFAIARVSDGTGHPDATFSGNWSGIKAAGMIRGVYQFFRASQNPTQQANLLLNAIGALGANDLAPVADVEVSDGVSGSQLVANLATWISVVKTATGREPMIYSAPGFWNGLPNTGQFSNVVLWVANWQVNCPDTPTPWGGWTFWQYTDSGSVPGISGNVDLDEFNGSTAQLGQPAATPDWGARYVSQSFPLATTALQMTAGQTIASYIELKNIGGKTWDSNTHLGTTQPRDRASVFADSSWLQPDRPAGVSGTVPPAGTYKFQFNLHAPNTAGTYHEYFGVVQEAIAWFSDPGQAGPPDNNLQVQIVVTGSQAVDAGAGATPGGSDAGMAPPSGAPPPGADASPPGATGVGEGGVAPAGSGLLGAGDGGIVRQGDGGPSNGATGGSPDSGGGCGCGVASPVDSPWTVAAGGCFVLLLCFRRGRRRSAWQGTAPTEGGSRISCHDPSPFRTSASRRVFRRESWRAIVRVRCLDRRLSS
jgi:lysozyme